MTAPMLHPRAAQFAAAFGLGILLPAVFAIAQGLVSGLIVAAWGWATVLLFYVGSRRGETARIMANAGDERIRTLHLKALAFAGFVMWAVLTAWWLASASSGDENAVVGVLAATFGVSYVGAAIYWSRTG